MMAMVMWISSTFYPLATKHPTNEQENAKQGENECIRCLIKTRTLGNHTKYSKRKSNCICAMLF